MKFPLKKYSNIESFKTDYYENLKKSFEYIRTEDLKKIISLLDKAYKNKKSKIMVCGNGGSAALANHFACDHQKILNKIGSLKPFVLSLCSNSSLMTAISNDSNYKFVFSDQIKQIGNKSDILITISSSGKSINIINAINVAKRMSIKTISFTGFDGGKSKKIADLNIHVKSLNYGIIESLHHTIMNLISQFLKNKYLSSKKIKSVKF
tara:strand:- start:57 stop:680 length:624 start_codon:yes stop_codon:yes gene_type:complete